MELKNIVLFERYDGVRFVLERSLSKYKSDIFIHSSHRMDEIKSLIQNRAIDLLITELDKLDTDGLEISCYARKHYPDLKIIWITVFGCHEFQDYLKNLDILHCIEKPLEISKFRTDVLEAIGVSSK